MFRNFFRKKDKKKDEVKEESTINEEVISDTEEVSEDEQVKDESLEVNKGTQQEVVEDELTEEVIEDSKIDFNDNEEDTDLESKVKIDEVSNTEKIDLESNKSEQKPIEEEKEGFFADFFKGLSKTRDNISNKIDEILSGSSKIDEELFENLEDILIMSDIGANSTIDIIENLRVRVKENKISEPEHVKKELNNIIKDYMNEDKLDNTININNTPLIILVVGVNGVGKTTSIGKLAKKYTDSGKSVLLCAADTFRAAAIEQLGEWANRVGVDMISHSQNADPGAVVFDAIAAAKSRNTDILIIDTAGRLHNKKNLMDELNKIYRIIEREYGEANLQTLMVLDATTGQNAMNQATSFSQAAHINGVILTKMDGTAKGGVVVRLERELKVPIKYIGLGEGIEDLREFNVNDFVDSII